ncbi:MAG: hypothetical protein CVU00_09845, partial [Bacteroidetes bacterium HGW-Bacteroidetes-17]
MKKILAIDDQQDNLTTLKAVIKSQIPDCIVFTALSGAEGIAIARKEHPDTILLDIIMPEMDGYEACRNLKNNELTRHIPIIMLTAIKTDAESRVKGLNIGADAFLAKPIDHTELAAQLKVMFRIKEAEDKLREEKQELTEINLEGSEKLKVSEEQYKYLFNSIRDAILVADNDRNIIDCNTAFTKIFGYSQNEIIGRKTSYCYENEEQFMALGKALKENFNTSTPFLYTVNYKKKNQEVFPGETDVYYLKDNIGNVSGFIGLIRDVTERKQAEEALYLSDERFTLAMKASNDGLFDWNLETNEIYYSVGWKKMLGYADYELPNDFSFWENNTEPEDAKKSWELQQKLISKQIDRFVFEFKMKHKKGHWVDILSRAEAIFDDNGKAIRIVGTHTDITEPKLTETALKESEEKFRKAFVTSPDSMNINRLDDGSYVTINHGFTQIMGYTEEEVIGKTSMELKIWRNPADREKFIEGLKAKGIVENLEAEFCAKNGDIKNGLISATIIELEGTPHILSIIRDNSIRKQTLLALKQSESLLKAIFESTGDGLLVVDINGLVTYKNDEFIKMWKIPSKLRKTEFDFKLLEAVSDQLVNPQQFLNKVNELYQSNQSDLDFLYFKDGRIFERNSQPLIIEDNIAGRVWRFSDITERKLAEKALFESEYRFSKLIQQSPFIIEIYDSQGLQVSVNTAYENLWGFPASQTVNKFNVLRSNEVEKTGLIKFVNQAYKGKVVSVPEYKFDPTGETEAQGLGRVRWLSTKIFPLKDPLGKVSNIVIMHEDVTDRKRSEQIQKVLYNISDTVTSSDNIEELIAKIKDHLSGIIDTTNYYIGLYDEQTKMISLPFVADEKDEIESFPAENSLTGHVIKTQKSLLVTYDQQEEMVKKGIIKFMGTRSQVWLGVPLKIDGVVKGTLAVQSYTDKNAYSESDREILEFVSDQISLSIERKQTEQKLIRALEKATESDRLKSAFLATMSHELRTPLNAIIGFSDIIKEDLPIAEIMEFNQTINSSGNHLLTIVEDLFDITLIETGELKIIKETVNLDSLLNEVNEIIKIEQLNLNKAHLELNLTIPDSKRQLRVNTDPWRLKQIFINLLKNALKFTHRGSVKFGFTINMVSEVVKHPLLSPAEVSRSTELKFFV